MKKEATQKCKGLKTKTSDEKRGNPKTQGAQKKDLRCKKSQPQNARGLNTKTSDEKRGNPKTQGAQKKDLRWKKRQPQNTKGSKERHLMKTRKCQNGQSDKNRTKAISQTESQESLAH
jgi:hypothetical protein